MDEYNLLTLEQSTDFDKNVVKKHFNQTDTKLLKLILSQIKGDVDNYLFDFKELESLGFDLENNVEEVFDSLKKISSYYVNVQNGQGDYYQMGLIHNKFTIDQETKILSLKVHKELVPFLSGLKQQYDLKQIGTL
jgi:hypothetical protein